MGIETVALAAMIGGSAFQGYQSIKTARSQAKAVTEQAAIDASNLAKRTERRADAARASFLSSGFDLFGTPEFSISGIFQAGQEDVGRTIRNANKSSKNIVSKARNEAIAGFLKTVGAASMSGGGGFNDKSGGAFNKMFSGDTLANNQTVRTLSTGQYDFIGPLPK